VGRIYTIRIKENHHLWVIYMHSIGIKTIINGVFPQHDDKRTGLQVNSAFVLMSGL
jgi:phosphate starvation-inducible membrane PsiE